MKDLKGNCEHCGGAMEFPAEHAGETAPCPHCQQTTTLLLALPPEETSPLRTRAIIFCTIALVILLAGVVGAQLAIKRAKRITGQSPQTPAAASNRLPDPSAAAGFRVSGITLEKTTNSTLTYAVGTVTDLARRKRFGVQVELNLLDREGKSCGTAKDYTTVLDAGGSWQFHAMVITPQAARATLRSITEDQ